MTAIAIVGSRDYPDLDAVRLYVRSLPHDAVVVTGGARGVDAAAEDEAMCIGLDVEVIPADWKTHGRGAGMIRNRSIAEHCDRLVAFWDGQSRGTAHVIECARKLGREVEIRRPA